MTVNKNLHYSDYCNYDSITSWAAEQMLARGASSILANYLRRSIGKYDFSNINVNDTCSSLIESCKIPLTVLIPLFIIIWSFRKKL